MTVLLKKILIYDSEGKNPIDITDDVRTTVKISQGSRGSTMDITLKNAWGEHVVGGEFQFGVDNIVKLWLKWAVEGTDTIDTSSSDDLIMASEVIDIEAKGEENSSGWTLHCVDRTFIILNRLWAKNYPLSGGLTAPEIIKEIINITTTDGKGTLSTKVKADLTEGSWNSTTGVFSRTGGGYIQHIRPDNTAFPPKAISKVFKPVYEWVDDLSQPDMTNPATELSESGTPICARPYFFYIDEDKNCHWEYPHPSASATVEMTWGSIVAVGSDTTAHYVKSFQLKNAVFDIVNMVIYNPGDDLYGSGQLDYFYDPTTRSPKLKPVYRAWTDIADDVIYRELFEENSASYSEDNATPGTLTYHGKRYTASYNLTPYWTTTAVTDDDELNDSLVAYCSEIGDNRARRLTQRKANPRWKGKITIRGEKRVIGELIQFNSGDHGIVNAKVRVTDVQHTISKEGWDVSLSVEEDALALGG